ncbi:hypothetical protein RND81_12G066000 [Saponaria officinalis]|uniref:Uncharacterized protein n=1 Tax=Saponaria officinalis TaxID=3572 RepID=A0AAW1H7D2_SAPOF
MGRVCVVGPSNITPILPHLVQYIKANKSKTHTDSLRTPFLPSLVTFVFSLYYSLSFLSRRSPARIIIIIITTVLRRRHPSSDFPIFLHRLIIVHHHHKNSTITFPHRRIIKHHQHQSSVRLSLD